MASGLVLCLSRLKRHDQKRGSAFRQTLQEHLLKGKSGAQLGIEPRLQSLLALRATSTPLGLLVTTIQVQLVLA